MKQFILAGSLLLLGFVYVSWRNNGNAAALRAEKDLKLEILENVLGGGIPRTRANAGRPNSPTGTGKMVPRADYQPCIDSFTAVMSRYGITADIPPVPIKSMPAMTYPITTSESLQGSGLLAFITAVVTKYDPDGKGANLDFQLQSGICTAKFVADYGEAPERVGRISTFIVPAYRTTDAAKAVKAKMRSVTGSDPGTNGYELGGVSP
ncbi:MAG TPA: hypothetical protein VL727_19800 [Puia sp.]|nr:hypothetical protein [Puia sp.]